ncbi:hypothetical protein CDAR_451901 [Caerostris darwini]|uniref:50S ribosomal protein L44e n=1 Tax=Caerostris darwini TaxID=1538125 RepID=A0AAV4X826_9ARAC|nr:hypothetical protein CDAR_451901 [Caerostris darwini]
MPFKTQMCPLCSRAQHHRMYPVKGIIKKCVNCKGSHVTYWRGGPRFPRKRHHQFKRKPDVIEKAPIKTPKSFLNFKHLIPPQSQLPTIEPLTRTLSQANHINNKAFQ